MKKEFSETKTIMSPDGKTVITMTVNGNSETSETVSTVSTTTTSSTTTTTTIIKNGEK